jgi:hypothetical protein
MNLGREEKLEQLERLLHSETLQGSESLKAFLRFVVLKDVENQGAQLKEYTIATEVFGRGDSYDPRSDSVVRVQAGRLRSKLHDYYTAEGKDDRVVIDLPKGHYSPSFAYNEGHNGGLASSSHPSLRPWPLRIQGRNNTNLLIALALVALGLTVVLLGSRAEVNRLKHAADVAGANSSPVQEFSPVWGDFFRSAGPILVSFSNTQFEGTAETGMKLLRPMDSPILGEEARGTGRSNAPTAITEHYTGIGEVMGVYALGDLFYKAGRSVRVKRSLLLTWDDLKSENIVVLGSPAENLLLRDLPRAQDFVFRVMQDENHGPALGLVNTKPNPGEKEVYLAKQDGPSRSQISEDYALISSLRGLDENRRIFILAGITTYGTQAAAEYVTKPEYLKELIANLNVAGPGEPARLPAYYQVLVRVKVNGGVPVQMSYVTHHVL